MQAERKCKFTCNFPRRSLISSLQSKDKISAKFRFSEDNASFSDKPSAKAVLVLLSVRKSEFSEQNVSLLTIYLRTARTSSSDKFSLSREKMQVSRINRVLRQSLQFSEAQPNLPFPSASAEASDLKVLLCKAKIKIRISEQNIKLVLIIFSEREYLLGVAIKLVQNFDLAKTMQTSRTSRVLKQSLYC